MTYMLVPGSHFQTDIKENKTMTEQIRTCATCTENDEGLCDLKGILIEDDDTCERWSNKQADWREHMLHTFLAGH